MTASPFPDSHGDEGWQEGGQNCPSRLWPLVTELEPCGKQINSRVWLVYKNAMVS